MSRRRPSSFRYDLAGALQRRSRRHPRAMEQGFGDALGAIPDGRRRFWGVPFRPGPGGGTLLGAAGHAGWGGGRGACAPGRAPAGRATSSSSAGSARRKRGRGAGGGAKRRAGRGPAEPDPGGGAGRPATSLCTATARRCPRRCAGASRSTAPGPPWGQKAFAARSHVADAPLEFRGPYERNGWGTGRPPSEQSHGADWLYALANPHPERRLREVRLEAQGPAAVAVAAITAFTGRDHPLRHRRLRSFRVTLPEALPDPAGCRRASTWGYRPQLRRAGVRPRPWLAGRGDQPPPPRRRAGRPAAGARAAPGRQRQRGRHPDRLRPRGAPASGLRGRRGPLGGRGRAGGGAVAPQHLAPRHRRGRRRRGRPCPAGCTSAPPDGRYLPPLRVPAGGERQLVRGLRRTT